MSFHLFITGQMNTLTKLELRLCVLVIEGRLETYKFRSIIFGGYYFPLNMASIVKALIFFNMSHISLKINLKAILLLVLRVFIYFLANNLVEIIMNLLTRNLFENTGCLLKVFIIKKDFFISRVIFGMWTTASSRIQYCLNECSSLA